MIITKEKSAFTLVELLVVIAIIAILASLALPAMNKAIENSKAISDLNLLNQMGKAFATYLSDNDDTFPASSGSTVWTKALNPKYMPAWKPYQSPFDKRAPLEDATRAPVSYGLNDNLVSKTMSDVGSSTNCILMAPVMSDPVRLVFDGTAASPSQLKKNSNGSGVNGGTHKGGKLINVLFADFHTSALSMSDFHSSLAPGSTNPSIKVSDIRWNQ